MTTTDGLRSRHPSYVDDSGASDGGTSKVRKVSKANLAKKMKKKRGFSPITIFLCLVFFFSLPMLYWYIATRRIAVSNYNLRRENSLPLDPENKHLPSHEATIRVSTPNDDTITHSKQEPPNSRKGIDQLNSPSEHTAKHSISKERPILTAYLETVTSVNNTDNNVIKPLPVRPASGDQLSVKQFSRVKKCSEMFETWPIDDYPDTDPFLPWIHDVFSSADGKNVHFVAQNRRRCMTGKGMEDKMKFWEPHMSLFQPIPVTKDDNGIRLASSFKEATHNETRFRFHFHTLLDEPVFEKKS